MRAEEKEEGCDEVGRLDGSVRAFICGLSGMFDMGCVEGMEGGVSGA